MPPPISLENCPKEIRENPLPFDECSEKVDPWLEPVDRFHRLSFNLDFIFLPQTPGDHWFRLGSGVLFRPIQNLGIGAQVDLPLRTDKAPDELNAFGKLQWSFPLPCEGKCPTLHSLTIGGLFGIKHLWSQNRETVAGGVQPVSGTMFNAGPELAWDIRFVRWMTLSPYAGITFTPASELSHGTSGDAVDVLLGVDVIFGLRLGFDTFRVGE